mmetsp:Transcript_19940/g.17672  ORF Transcript_19940/g.17672 Transcript_19940/m.17672 type:complete len:163 (-) Transcript_19940:33-521(-)
MNAYTITILFSILIKTSYGFCQFDCTGCVDDAACRAKYDRLHPNDFFQGCIPGWLRCVDESCEFSGACGDDCNIFNCNCDHCSGGHVKGSRRRMLNAQNKLVFDEIDLNGDNKISLEEFLIHFHQQYKNTPKLTQEFYELDDNNDGFINPKEFDGDLQDLEF